MTDVEHTVRQKSVSTANVGKFWQPHALLVEIQKDEGDPKTMGAPLAKEARP
jgi:hypothetical protein